MTPRTRKLAVGAVATLVAIAALVVWAGGGENEPRIEARVVRHDNNYAVIRFTNASRSAMKVITNPSYSPSPGITNFMIGYGAIGPSALARKPARTSSSVRHHRPGSGAAAWNRPRASSVVISEWQCRDNIFNDACSCSSDVAPMASVTTTGR